VKGDLHSRPSWYANPRVSSHRAPSSVSGWTLPLMSIPETTPPPCEPSEPAAQLNFPRCGSSTRICPVEMSTQGGTRRFFGRALRAIGLALGGIP